jgi:hypothetical protein
MVEKVNTSPSSESDFQAHRKEGVFEPAILLVMGNAYDRALQSFAKAPPRLVREQIASNILALTRRGMSDPVELYRASLDGEFLNCGRVAVPHRQRQLLAHKPKARQPKEAQAPQSGRVKTMAPAANSNRVLQQIPPPKAGIRSHEWHVRSGSDGNKLIIAFDGCRAGVSANRARNCATLPTC